MKEPYKLYMGDCLEVLKTKKENIIDSIVTDPPYGLNFMGKNWDHGIPGVKFWKEALRVAKPGAFLLAFGGTRTFHRLACAIEDAGWEIRDCIMYIYGSGFPKSLNISKAIDKKLGKEREVISEVKTKSGGMAHISKTNAEHGFRPKAYKGHSLGNEENNVITKTLPASKEAKKFDGYGTSLKPAWEPIIIARKPVEGTIVDNVLKYGTGGINIDKCRVQYSNNKDKQDLQDKCNFTSKSKSIGFGSDKTIYGTGSTPLDKARQCVKDQGRFPANLIHDGSNEVLELFPLTESGRSNGNAALGVPGNNVPLRRGELISRNDGGSAARFFYCAKTSQKDREKGNDHVTVKPTDLMRYLVKLVTPPNGRVLDMFMGSGSTGKAAILEGFRFIGIEQEEKSFLISEKRIKKSFEKQQLRLFR